MVKGFGVQVRKPKSQDRPSGCGGKSRIGDKSKSGLGNQDQKGQFEIRK